MSASTEKKNRQAAREAGTDKKMLAAQEEASKKAQSKRRWTLGTIAVVLLIAGFVPKAYISLPIALVLMLLTIFVLHRILKGKAAA